jgi:hypothetical protein
VGRPPDRPLPMPPIFPSLSGDIAKFRAEPACSRLFSGNSRGALFSLLLPVVTGENARSEPLTFVRGYACHAALRPKVRRARRPLSYAPIVASRTILRNSVSNAPVLQVFSGASRPFSHAKVPSGAVSRAGVPVAARGGHRGAPRSRLRLACARRICVAPLTYPRTVRPGRIDRPAILIEGATAKVPYVIPQRAPGAQERQGFVVPAPCSCGGTVAYLLQPMVKLHRQARSLNL